MYLEISYGVNGRLPNLGRQWTSPHNGCLPHYTRQISSLQCWFPFCWNIGPDSCNTGTLYASVCTLLYIHCSVKLQNALLYPTQHWSLHFNVPCGAIYCHWGRKWMAVKTSKSTTNKREIEKRGSEVKKSIEERKQTSRSEQLFLRIRFCACER